MIEVIEKIAIAVVVCFFIAAYAFGPSRGRCASCEEIEYLDENCPYCAASICSSCFRYAESDLEDEAYYEGYDDGYEYGYRNGFSAGAEAGYCDGYDEGYERGYADALIDVEELADSN